MRKEGYEKAMHTGIEGSAVKGRWSGGLILMICLCLLCGAGAALACDPPDCGDCGYWDEELEQCIPYMGNKCAVDDHCDDGQICASTCICISDYACSACIDEYNLPSGCDCAGEKPTAVIWVDGEELLATDLVGKLGDFSATEAIYDPSFGYTYCSWVCEMGIVACGTLIKVMDPVKLAPGMISVSSAADVPCGYENQEAWIARYDLNDPDISDDQGAPNLKYWCYDSAVAHEQRHRSDWKEFYGDELEAAISLCEYYFRKDVDCAVEWTQTCQGVESEYMPYIIVSFWAAKNNALELFDDPSTPLDEAEQRAYLASYAIEQPIVQALPAGCTP